MEQDVQRAFEEKAFGKQVIVPRFFEHARKDSRLSTGYGINIYTSSTYVEIKTKGRKDTTTRRATEDDKALFSHHYSRYAATMDSNSIPMEALAGYSMANQFILRDLDITTVEELAEHKDTLPLASLKLMQHCAVEMVNFASMYQPPNFSDEMMEVPHETIQAQRQVLPTGQSLGATDGQEGNNGSGVQRFGVTLDPEGNITEFNGQEVQKGQQESQQKEVKKVISFY